ncbi:putative phosphotransferase system, EIIC component [Gottschalkia purinilytica]|uniref:Putative phosphotransferase system, EIIC component n=1 Tax=Gottschalkia purinilytica TaxID=1503 RepID=A0A0L0W6A6_GOTPU|nr:PTS sugar transporter subunit IIC [Gottschalkia purinilytica]KNF07012.1 putative phosphotransferase system, EIIC component [Gottschalkia purinilytica]
MKNSKKTTSIRDYLIKVLNGMALGLFSSLIIGLILKQIGIFLNIKLLVQFGQVAQFMMGPAIGAGVAYSLGASPLGIFASTVAGAIGGQTITVGEGGTFLANIGEPVGALLSSLLGVEASKIIQGKTKVDIVLVPAVTIIVGGVSGFYLAPFVAEFMTLLGKMINLATQQQPVIMGILVSVLMGIILTLPISSAAIGIALGLDGLAAGAAIVGCATNMIGFAVASFRENGVGGLIAQGLGTSMLQIPNIIKNPRIFIPPILTSAILGPISTVVFKMEGNKIGSGMGTSGLVGQFSTIEVMGSRGIFGIILLHFVLPATITFLISEYMRKKKWIKYGDMKLNN